MKANVGSTDRIVRILLGIGLLSLLLILPAPQKYFGLIGLIPILTAMINFCPLYRLLGISTRKSG